jgi:hypothetical protein
VEEHGRGVIMGKRVVFATAAGVILIGFLMSCTFSGISDVEFAKELVKESSEATKEATTEFTEPVKDNPDSSPGEQYPIQIVLPEDNPPIPGPYQIIFTNFTPAFAPNSLVSGELELTITLSSDPYNPTVTLQFEGELIVTGEHEGTYSIDVSLVVDLSTWEYTYSYYIITIDGREYKSG